MTQRLIYLIIGFLSILLFLRVGHFYLTTKPYPQGSVVTFEGRLTNQPKLSSSGQRVSLVLPNHQRVSVLFALLPPLSYGDKVKVMGKIEYFEVEDGKKFASIRYPRFVLLEKGTEANLLYRVRESIISFFNSNLSPISSALVLGITFGIKQEMPPSFFDDLQKSGLTHVIAASGMNITMVGGFMIGLFGIFFRRQLALVISIFGILVYTLLAGFEPSIVRAAIMGILVFSASLWGRQSTAFLSLYFAGFLMLSINPSLLLDIGFQLSFVATMGLIFVRPIFTLNPRLKTIIEKSIIGEDLATTLTAQIATLPILLVNFGSYALSSVLVNTLVLWTIPIIMIFGGMSALVALVYQPIATPIAYLCVPFLLYFEQLVKVFSNFGGYIEIKSLPFLIIAGYYLLLLSLILFINKRK